MKEPLISELKTHLEFLGYDVSIDKDGDLSCRHPRHFNCIATEFVGGVVFLATFGGLKVAESDEVEALRAMNGLNAGSAVTIAYMGASRNVALSAWYPLPYSKASFSAFSEQWHREQTK